MVEGGCVLEHDGMSEFAELLSEASLLKLCQVEPALVV